MNREMKLMVSFVIALILLLDLFPCGNSFCRWYRNSRSMTFSSVLSLKSHEAPSSSLLTSTPSTLNPKEKIRVVYDSGCPICSLEVELLKKRDLYRKILFTDIADPDQRQKILYIEGMKRLRITLPNKKTVAGRDVFKVAYRALGLGWLYELTRLPILTQLADIAFDYWAEHQLKRDPEDEELLQRFQTQAKLLQTLKTTTIDALSDYSSYSSVAEGQIDLLYDKDCPICNMEVEFLRKRDIYQRIQFTDISSADYDPRQHGNVNYVDGMKKLRAVLPDGRVVTGVEVFRYTYEAIGLGWVFAATRLPVIGQIADAIYDLWAENRLRITGRHDLAEKLKVQAEAVKAMELEDCEDSCDLEDEAEEEEEEEEEEEN